MARAKDQRRIDRYKPMLVGWKGSKWKRHAQIIYKDTDTASIVNKDVNAEYFSHEKIIKFCRVNDVKYGGAQICVSASACM